jgi:hypothetical protein
VIAALLALAVASQGSEIVIVLDNSASMAATYSDSAGKQYPANDPERAAVLGALLVEGLARGSADRVSVIQFGQGHDPTPVVATGADAIRAVPYVGGTLFRKPLLQARQILEASPRPEHLFVIFTDGMPQDLDDPSEGPRLLGLDAHPDWDSIAIGLYADKFALEAGEPVLTPLARNPDSLVFLQSAKGVVTAFTRAYARSLGSRPESGALAPGQHMTFEPGRYVTEVMITLASTSPGAPFNATVTGPSGAVPSQASGDNGCPPQNALSNAPAICSQPRRHYQVFRAPNNPDQASKWSIDLGSGGGSVEYGIILRYDLQAALSLPQNARVGEAVEVKANLVFRGKIVDDPAFFQSDGFEMSATIAGEAVQLHPVGGGVFAGTWAPKEPTQGAPLQASLIARNAWLDKRATAPISVEGFLDLSLQPNPSAVELGAWRGARVASRRCATVDLTGSRNADRVPLTCTAAGAPSGAAVSCQPIQEPVPGTKQPLRWEVCTTATACCGEVDSGPTVVRFAGAHPHYASSGVDVPVRFHVQSTGFLRCWWIWIASAAAALFAIWFLLGWTRPHNFDPSASVRIAASEIGLRRAEGMILQEQPSGRRGFYRSARICLDGEGAFHRSAGAAALVLEAGPHGLTRFLSASLERKEPRGGKWAPLTAEQLAEGFESQIIYRSGNLFIQFS